jgi:hypothetical protein
MRIAELPKIAKPRRVFSRTIWYPEAMSFIQTKDSFKLAWPIAEALSEINDDFE